MRQDTLAKQIIQMTCRVAFLIACASLASRGILSRNPRLETVHAAGHGFQGPVGRNYGWARLGDILGPTPRDGVNKWLTWSTKCDYLGNRNGLPLQSQMNLSPDCSAVRQTNIQGVLRSAEPSKQEPTAIQHFASVFFNDIAARAVITRGLNLNLGQSSPPAASRTNPAAITPFDDRSVIVKAIWEVVNQEGTSWPLNVYDPQNIMVDKVNADGTPSKLKQVEDWKTRIYLNPSVPASCPFKTRTYIALNVSVPLGCFVYQYVPASVTGDMLIATRGRVLRYPYLLVLVGIHVARKEAGHWIWSTFWWTNRPDGDAAHFAGQPASLPAQYLQFAMDTTAAGGAVVYNPYQEGPQGEGAARSNCANCHSVAAYQKTLKPLPPWIGLHSTMVPANYWQDTISTDSVWSIATARDTTRDLFGPTSLFELSKSVTGHK